MKTGRWRPAEVRKLLAMREAGLKFPQIAEKLDRNVATVRVKFWGITHPESLKETKRKYHQQPHYRQRYNQRRRARRAASPRPRPVYIARRRWSEAELKRLERLKHLPYAEIARRMGRSVGSIAGQCFKATRKAWVKTEARDYYRRVTVPARKKLPRCAAGPWTAQEVAQFLDMRASGIPPLEIAQILGRSPQAQLNKYKQLTDPEGYRDLRRRIYARKGLRGKREWRKRYEQKYPGRLKDRLRESRARKRLEGYEFDQLRLLVQVQDRLNNSM